MRSRLLKTTVLAAAAGAMWTQMPQVILRWNSRRWPSLKCCFMGHEDWIRRAPDRLYLECFECGRETQGWATGTSQSARSRYPYRRLSDQTSRPFSTSFGPFANETVAKTRPRRKVFAAANGLVAR
jgi:hypothetical protein